MTSKTTGLILLFGVLLLGLVSSASAAPLGLLQTPPDISAAFIQVNYDGAGNLTASGFPQQLTLDSAPGNFDTIVGTFDIIATLQPTTGAFISGTLVIDGTISGTNTGFGGTGPGNLLTANLIAFGFPNSPPGDLEFVWSVSGGLLSGGTPFGTTVGTLLHASGYAGSFDGVSFDNGFSSSANTFAIPEPALGSLLLMGLVGLALRRRRDA